MRALAQLRRHAAATARACVTAPDAREFAEVSGGAAAQSLTLVQVRKVDGSGGSLIDPPDFTYDLWDLSVDPETTDPLNVEPLEPEYQHSEPGLFIAAADDTPALAFQDPRDENNWNLLWVFDERRDPGPCSGG